MNRLVYNILIVLMVSLLAGLVFFGLNPIKSISLSILGCLFIIGLVQGLRRKSLGLPFISKYSPLFSKDFYREIYRMHCEK